MSQNPTIHPLTAAKFYLACGYSVVPILPDGSKAPSVAWKPYTQARPTPKEIEQWFSGGDRGIALIQGEVSGNSELLEFETEETYLNWYRIMNERGHRDIAEALNLCVFSPGGGVHIFYRHDDEAQGNRTLASTATPVPGHKQGKDGLTTLIETRGQGGYVLAPGSLPACHPTGKLYRLAKGSSFARVPFLTAEERITVFDACRALDEKPVPTQKPRPARAIETQGAGDGMRPGDDFNERGGAEALACLERHGWSVAKDHGEWQEMCRPGKTRGSSATFGYVAPGVLHVFSSNAAPFELDATCGAFEIVTVLDFGGDYKACARMLGTRGFGTPLPAPAYAATTATPKQSRPAMSAADYEAMKQEGREIHIRLVAVLRLCELGHVEGWHEAMPGASADLAKLSKTMSLPDCLESLLAELRTPAKGKAWDTLRQIDDLMDEADVYVDNHDCVMHYMDWLHTRFPASEQEGQEVGL